jgi:hypothetical protein
MLGQISFGGFAMKTLSIFLSLINALLAGVILLASLSEDEFRSVALLWSLTKSLALLGVLGLGGLTWFGLLTNSRPGVLAFGNLALIVLGTAAMVWALHLATLGHMDFLMALYGFSLLVQGMASLGGFVEDGRSVTA